MNDGENESRGGAAGSGGARVAGGGVMRGRNRGGQAQKAEKAVPTLTNWDLPFHIKTPKP